MTAEIAPKTLLRLVILGALIGIPAALAALAFFTAAHYLEHFLWTDLPQALGEDAPPPYLILGLPVIGALIVAAARLFLPGDGGHNPLAGMSSGPTAVRFVPGVVAAALGTLGFGLVLGPEAPVMAIGSAVGVGAMLLVKADAKSERLLSMTGIFAAISTLFGGPLVGGVMITETGIGLGAALIPALLPGFAAAATGYLIFAGLARSPAPRRRGSRSPTSSRTPRSPLWTSWSRSWWAWPPRWPSPGSTIPPAGSRPRARAASEPAPWA